MIIQPGEILASKYRIDGVLGVGGMGTVLAATHLELEQRVAIKLPHAAQISEATLATRFMREGKNAARIRSDHVARVLDVGRTEAGVPFLVMEYLEGHDLSQHLKARGRLPLADSIDIVLQACDAVAAAHAVGIVHRDLKPANLFLEQRNDASHHVKILDFGISKVLADDPAALEAALTSTTGIIGSPMYMSPEQMIAARHVDTRTDVWSLGLILFKCLTGQTPWPSGNAFELAARIARDPPIKPRALMPDMPEGLELAILRCLEKDRVHRTASALDLAIAIAPFDGARGEDTLRRMRRNSSTSLPTASAIQQPVRSALEPETLATSAYTVETELDDGKRHEPAIRRSAESEVETYTGATTGPRAVRRAGSRARIAIVASVVVVAMLIGIAAMLRTPSRAPAAASQVSVEAEATKSLPEKSPLSEKTADPTAATAVTPTAIGTASSKLVAGAAASAKPLSKPSAKPMKDGDAPPATTSKPKSPDPWGNW